MALYLNCYRRIDIFRDEVVSTYFFVKISSALRVDFFTLRGSDAGIVTDERGKIRKNNFILQ